MTVESHPDPTADTLPPGAAATAAGDAQAEVSRQQAAAADPSATVWVDASAGTGKTKVLTDRVLRLMLAGSGPERLLCITFTRAAAAEMADRVASRLAGWVTLDDAALTKALTALLGVPPDPAILPRARTLFAQTLDTPGGLKIQTIHAFAQSVLRRFPLEAGVSPTFEAMDEAAAKALLLDCRRALLADPPAAVAEALFRLVEAVGQEEFAALMATLTQERARLARLFRLAEGAEGLIDRVYRHLGADPGRPAAAILEDGVGDPAVPWAALGRAATVLAEGSANDRKMAAAMQAWLARDPADRIDTLEQWRGAFFTTTGSPKKTLATQQSVAAWPAILDVLSAEQARLDGLIDFVNAARMAERTADLLTVGAALLRDYEAAKRREGALDYDDLILKTADLLQDAEGRGAAAWVLFKLDGGIDHLLVDEAQDTNPEQWQVIEALVAEFYAGLDPRPPRPDPRAGTAPPGRTLFVVGDAKQSIFSFQRADPATFDKMRRHFREATTAAERDWRDIAMTTSFRSTEAVLRLVDAVFAEGLARDGVIPPDLPLIHGVSRTGMAGQVDLWPPVAKPEAADLSPWEVPGETAATGDAKSILAARIADRVERWLADGTILESRARPIAPGDILILVRRRDALFNEIVRALKDRAIPVAGVDRMVLTDALAVADLLALADVALLPEDDLSLATVLKSPLIGLDPDGSDAALFALAHGRRDSLWAALQARARSEGGRWAVIADWLQRIRAETDFTPPFEWLSRILSRPCPADDRSGRRAILKRLGVEAVDPIDALLAQAMAFERDQPASLTAFLAWLRGGETEIKREMDSRGGLVRMMTVHGAKGLQAPIVFLPDTTAVPRMTDRLFWPEREATDVPLFVARKGEAERHGRAAWALRQQRQMEEYRRLLYVALTRAEDRSIVCGAATGKGDGVQDGSWYSLIADGMDRLPGVTTEADGTRVFKTEQRAEVTPPDLEPVLPLEAELPDWALRPAPREPSPARPLTPSQPTVGDPAQRSPLQATVDGRFARGRVIHALLQTLPDLPPAARPAAARRYVATPALRLPEAEREAAVQETLAVLDDPEYRVLFGPGSRAEVPIVGQIGQGETAHVLSGQIDRLVVLDRAVLIVDYKTNRSPPDAVPTAYWRQMAGYRAILRRLYPDRSIRCVLLWTDGARWMELEADRLEAVWAAMGVG